MVKSIGALFAELGLALVAAERYAEAEHMLEQAFEEDSDDLPYAETYQALAQTYEALGKLEAAYDTYRQLAMGFTRTQQYAAVEPILRHMLTLVPQDVEVLEYLGWALLNQGKTAESLNVFLEGVQLQEDWAPFHSGLGLNYVNLGNYQEALREYARALELNPEDHEALFGQGSLLREVGDLEGSITTLRRLLALVPESPAFYTFQLGLSYESLGDTAMAVENYIATARRLLEQERYTDAQQIAERALGLDPNSGAAHLQRGLALYAQGQNEEAIAALQQALALAPSAEIYYHLAELYHDSEIFEPALEAVNQALALQPDWIDAMAQKGAILRRLERNEEALQLLDDALAENPEWPWAHAERGAVLSNLDRNEEALEAFRKAVSLAPDYPFANVQLGILLMLLDRDMEALPILKHALTLSPDNRILFYFHGLALYNLDRYEEALDAFDEVLQRDIGDVEAAYYRGACLRLLNRFDEAITALQAAEDLEAAKGAVQPRTYAELGEAMRMAGRHREAIEAFRSAVELEPDYQWALARYGETLRFLGRNQEAVELLERAVELNKEDSWAFGSLGAAYSSVERQRSAILALDRALALNPEYTWAWSWKGVVLRQARRYADAVQALERALERDPQAAWLHGEKGLALRQLGVYERASSSLLQAVRLDSQYAWGYGQLACTAYLLGEDAGALQHAEHALSLDRSLLWVHQVRSVALQRLGREEEAQAAHTEGLADPESFQAFLDRGNTYADLLAFDRAIVDFQQAVQLAPDNPEPYNTLAWLYADTMGTHLEEATALAEQALLLASCLEEDTFVAPTSDTLGWTYCKRGLFAEGLPHLERAVALSDEDLLTQDHLEFCRRMLDTTSSS